MWTQPQFSKTRTMRRNILGLLAALAVGWISGASVGGAVAGSEQFHLELIPGDRIVLGTVEEVRGDQARIHTGKGQPRFVPMKVRKDKGLPELKKGDLIEVTINDQNLLVDVHIAGESGVHRVVRGQLAVPLVTGHDKAVLRNADGREESHFIRPVARNKVASIPVGADVIFLIDELDKIVDVTMESLEAVHRATELGQQKSPLKSNLSQVAGKVLKPLKENAIVIRTETGKEHSYEVRTLIQSRLATLSKGDDAVFLVDNEDKVADVSFVAKK